MDNVVTLFIGKEIRFSGSLRFFWWDMFTSFALDVFANIEHINRFGNIDREESLDHTCIGDDRSALVVQRECRFEESVCNTLVRRYRTVAVLFAACRTVRIGEVCRNVDFDNAVGVD